MYLANTVTDNVNWFNQLINNSGWERVIAIGFFAVLIALAIGARMGWVTIGNKTEELYKSQIEALNTAVQNNDTNRLSKIESKVEKIETMVAQLNEMLPLVRTISSEVDGINDELRDLRRGGGRGVS